MRKNLSCCVAVALFIFCCANSAIAENTAILPEQQIPEILSVEKETPSPVLTAPVVEDVKTSKKTSRKIDLRAVIFDPNADFKAQAEEENRELTAQENLEYNLHEALHGEVKALSTKGLLADKMKMTFEKGPIDNIVPWLA